MVLLCPAGNCLLLWSFRSIRWHQPRSLLSASGLIRTAGRGGRMCQRVVRVQLHNEPPRTSDKCSVELFHARDVLGDDAFAAADETPMRPAGQFMGEGVRGSLVLASSGSSVRA